MLKFIKIIALAALCPLLLFLGSIFLPEPFATSVFKIASSPAHVLPFLENEALMQRWTETLLGRMTVNYAPIQIIVLSVFWFVVAFVLLWCAFKLCELKKAKAS